MERLKMGEALAIGGQAPAGAAPGHRLPGPSRKLKILGKALAIGGPGPGTGQKVKNIGKVKAGTFSLFCHIFKRQSHKMT